MASVEKYDEFIIEFENEHPFVVFYDSDVLDDSIIHDLQEKIIKDFSSDSSSITETNILVKQNMDNLLDDYIDGRRFSIDGDEIILDSEYESEVIKIKQSLINLLKKLDSIKFMAEDDFMESHNDSK